MFSIKSLHVFSINEFEIRPCNNEESRCYNCQKILGENRITYLGKIIDSDLRWDVQIGNAFKIHDL